MLQCGKGLFAFDFSKKILIVSARWKLHKCIMQCTFLGLCHFQYFAVAHFSENETFMWKRHVFQYVYVHAIPVSSMVVCALDSNWKWGKMQFVVIGQNYLIRISNSSVDIVVPLPWPRCLWSPRLWDSQSHSRGPWSASASSQCSTTCNWSTQG